MSIEKIKAPITPEIVLLGLILVSFFPFNNLPKKYPPRSDAIEIITEYKKNNL